MCHRYRVQEFCDIVSEYLVFIDTVYYCARLILALILQERQLLSYSITSQSEFMRKPYRLEMISACTAGASSLNE